MHGSLLRPCMVLMGSALSLRAAEGVVCDGHVTRMLIAHQEGLLLEFEIS